MLNISGEVGGLNILNLWISFGAISNHAFLSSMFTKSKKQRKKKQFYEVMRNNFH